MHMEELDASGSDASGNSAAVAEPKDSLITDGGATRPRTRLLRPMRFAILGTLEFVVL